MKRIVTSFLLLLILSISLFINKYFFLILLIISSFISFNEFNILIKKHILKSKVIQKKRSKPKIDIRFMSTNLKKIINNFKFTSLTKGVFDMIDDYEKK